MHAFLVIGTPVILLAAVSIVILIRSVALAADADINAPAMVVRRERLRHRPIIQVQPRELPRM